MKKYSGLILDLDGCIYWGDRLISGSREAVEKFRESGLKLFFLTNNSTMTSEQYSLKLKRMGIIVDPEEILTSGEATAIYILKESGLSRVMALTGEGFKEYCRRIGHVLVDIEQWSRVDYVVAGLDLEFNYMKLKAAMRAILSGAKFVATNSDSTIPVNDGVDPGAGAIVAAIRESTSVDPIVIGKPSRIIIDMCLEKMRLDRDKVLIVGDRIETDVEVGKRSGIDTALVLSGITTREKLESISREKKPDYVAENLLHLYEILYMKGLI
ncbi:MAG: HAD-IIA family hydrolase [Nitrososphaerota archaeon]